jgi:(p)ppGpp synthase/HD superfamily hydrolase
VGIDVTATARALAERAHKGQRDKAFRDYFDAHLVPIASAAAVFGDDVEAAAWLHDSLEDTTLCAPDLASAGIPMALVAAVESVTRRSNETYRQLIARACVDPVGRYVKLVDNSWNITSNPALVRSDPVKAASLLTGRYVPARRQLLDACGLTLRSATFLEMQRILDRHDQRLSESL